MNISSSECSSGCESGWTMYLDQSANYADQFEKAGGRIAGEDCRHNKAAAADVEDQEDLSMVSDASSGPPHNVLEDDDPEDCCDGTGYFSYGSASHELAKKSKNKKKIIEQRGKQLHSYLDDTASSPSKKHTVLLPSGTPMENTLGFSQGVSSKHFKPQGKSTMRKHLGFFRSSMSGNPASGPAGGLQGRKWE